MFTIIDQIATQETKGLQVRRVFQGNTYELLSISLEEGCQFPEHTSPRDAVLLVLHGRIIFRSEGRSFELAGEDLFHFPAAAPHWVEALENSKFIIIR